MTSQSPADYRLWASLGVALSQQSRFDEAITAYRKALAIKPGEPQTELNLAIACFKGARFSQAIPALRSVTATAGDTAQTDVLLGMSYFGSGDFQTAVPYLQRAQSREPENAELRRVLVESFLHAGEYGKAMAQVTELLRQHPDSPEVHMLLCQAYDATNQPDKAIEEFRIATAQSAPPNAHFGLGYLLWKERRYDDAAAEFTKELASDPNNSQALLYLGDVALTEGDRARAEELLRRSAALRGDARLVYLDLGIMESENKQYEAAERDLNHATRLDPNLADAHYRLARLYRETNRPADAERELALVKKLHDTTRQDLLLKISGPGAAVRSQ